jgi:hypothetical protein
LREPLLLESPAVGVGIEARENPDSLSSMRSANGGRSQHSPFRIVPERGQVSEDNVESSTSESWGVFHEDESRSNLANDASHLPPESGPFSAEAGALPRD